MALRILHVARTLRRETGGVAEAVRSLSAALQDAGHESHTLSLDPADAELGDPQVSTLGQRSHGYGYDRAYVPWLRANRSRFDATVVHGLWQYQTWGAWRALAGTSTPYFVYCHGMLDSWFKRAYPLKHLKKWLYWPWAEYRALRDAQAVLFTCEEERRRARESFWLYRCREAVTGLGTSAPIGSEQAQREAFRSLAPQTEGRRFLLFLGRLHEKKGCDLLVEAFAKTASESRLQLVVAGPDPDGQRAGLIRQAEHHGVASRVVWLEMLTGDAKWGAFRCADAFVLPSHQENFGLTVAEALSCGTPVLISDQVNIWREVERCGAGLVEADTVEGTRRLLAHWEEIAPEEKVAMRQRAVECFAQHLEIGQAARNLAEVIASARSPERRHTRTSVVEGARL